MRVRVRVRARVRVRVRGGHPPHLLRREAGRGEADHDMVAAPVARPGRSVVPPPPAQVVLERGGAVQ